MRVVRQILVGLGLIVIGVGGVVAAQGIFSWTQPGPQSSTVEAIAIAILGALLVIGGLILLIKGIRRRPVVVAGQETGD